MIELKNISKTYGKGEKAVTAIKEVNITINDGEIFGIIGLSGAGKSTLVRCINRASICSNRERFSKMSVFHLKLQA